MSVFLEREIGERKDGKYLLNSVAILVADWLYDVEKKESERSIHCAVVIHWLLVTGRRRSDMKYTAVLASCSVIFAYRFFFPFFIPMFLVFLYMSLQGIRNILSTKKLPK